MRGSADGRQEADIGFKEREVLSDYRGELEEIAGRLDKIKEYL